MTPALDPIETLCVLDAAGRGIARLVVPPEEEARLTRAMVAAGGVDGLTGAARPTVDSLPLGLHQSVLTTLRELTAHLMTRRAGRETT